VIVMLDASRNAPLRVPVTVTVWPLRTASVRNVCPPDITGVLAEALTVVKSSIRKLMSMSPAPLRARFTTGPERVTDG